MRFTKKIGKYLRCYILEALEGGINMRDKLETLNALNSPSRIAKELIL